MNWAPQDYESANVFSTLADVQIQQHASQQGDINKQTAGEMLVSAATMCRHTKGRADTKLESGGEPSTRKPPEAS
eukprot:3849629-Pyramimonas_sp.AAC.1